MTYKNLGLGVSQLPQEMGVGDQFSREEKSFESIVIQAIKPVIDWEMNLRGEVSSDYGLRLSNSRLFPSCWLSSSFLENPGIGNSYTVPTPIVGNENKFTIISHDLMVNGWQIKFEYSGTATNVNIIDLPVPPLANYRVDLVILEVWRALITAVPSITNKSPTGLILRHGNVKCPD